MKFNFIDFLSSQKKEKYWENIEKVISKDNFVPSKELIFAAFDNFDFDNLKLVIIGQDPYPTNNNADGLAFSTNNLKLRLHSKIFF